MKRDDIWLIVLCPLDSGLPIYTFGWNILRHSAVFYSILYCSIPFWVIPFVPFVPPRFHHVPWRVPIDYLMFHELLYIEFVRSHHYFGGIFTFYGNYLPHSLGTPTTPSSLSSILYSLYIYIPTYLYLYLSLSLSEFSLLRLCWCGLVLWD